MCSSTYKPRPPRFVSRDHCESNNERQCAFRIGRHWTPSGLCTQANNGSRLLPNLEASVKRAGKKRSQPIDRLGRKIETLGVTPRSKMRRQKPDVAFSGCNRSDSLKA